MRTAFFLISTALLFAASHAAIADDFDRWQVDGDLYLGSLIPDGTETDAGITMGGKAGLRYESKGRKVLIYGELMGEGFNNSKESSDIQFSQFYLNTGLMVGTKAVKWKTPINIDVSRDIISNDDLTVRYAFSGLYVRFIDEKNGDKKFRQLLEGVSDFVVARVGYMTGYELPPCDPYNGCPVPSADYRYPATSRTILGLYAALRYGIEKNGWGSDIKLELLQDISPSYTRVNAKVVGYKALSGDLANLRPFIEIDGLVDHDGTDPSGSLQTGVRVLGGIGGRFGM